MEVNTWDIAFKKWNTSIPFQYLGMYGCASARSVTRSNRCRGSSHKNRLNFQQSFCCWVNQQHARKGRQDKDWMNESEHRVPAFYPSQGNPSTCPWKKWCLYDNSHTVAGLMYLLSEIRIDLGIPTSYAIDNLVKKVQGKKETRQFKLPAHNQQRSVHELPFWSLEPCNWMKVCKDMVAMRFSHLIITLSLTLFHTLWSRYVYWWADGRRQQP